MTQPHTSDNICHRPWNPEQIRLGITGGIGSGKSYVSHMLAEEWSVPVYDCDSRAKYLTAHSEQIREALVSISGKTASCRRRSWQNTSLPAKSMQPR